MLDTTMNPSMYAAYLSAFSAQNDLKSPWNKRTREDLFRYPFHCGRTSGRKDT